MEQRIMQKKGMTWEEWVNSSLYVKSSGIYISGNYVLKNSKNLIIESGTVTGKDIIIENKNYTMLTNE